MKSAAEVLVAQETQDEEMAHSIARAVADRAYADVIVIDRHGQGLLRNLTYNIVLQEIVRRKGAK